jgi:hypothetical protein
MKRILLICMFIFAGCSLFAQTLPQFNQIKLQTNKDYKSAEPQVVQTADFVLTTPIDTNSSMRTLAAQFLMKWMDGTPDYTFTLDENSTRFFLQNNGLMMVYVASMAKYAIQNKPHNSKDITINAIKNLLAYINNPANNVKKNNELKELSQANDHGELESFLNL